jgi:hypothetical protein
VIAARESTIVVMICQELPSFMALAEDIRFAGFSLSMKGIERLFQTLFGRLSGINRAPNTCLSRDH